MSKIGTYMLVCTKTFTKRKTCHLRNMLSFIGLFYPPKNLPIKLYQWVARIANQYEWAQIQRTTV